MCAIPSERIFAVTGFKREARIIGARPDRMFIAGDGTGLAERLDRAAAGGRCAILSIGIAGGLVPGLAPGAVVVASSVLTSGRRFRTAKAWTDKLAQIMPDAHVGPIVGESRILASAAEKAALRRATGALAVDMESQIAAEVANAYHVPFTALRVIADPAEQSLPAAAQSALTPSGGVSVARVLRALLAKPADLGALIRTACDAQAAFRGLARCCRLAGPRFCLPDVGELLLDVS
jgi:hopanoid-associated phosphorylase